MITIYGTSTVCTVTNFSVWGFSDRLQPFDSGCLGHKRTHLDPQLLNYTTTYLKVYYIAQSPRNVHILLSTYVLQNIKYSTWKCFYALFNILASLLDVMSISSSLSEPLITFCSLADIQDPWLPINYFCGHLTLGQTTRLRTLFLPSSCCYEACVV